MPVAPCFSTAVPTIKPLPVKGLEEKCPVGCTKTDTFMYDSARSKRAPANSEKYQVLDGPFV